MIFKDSPHQWFLLHVGGLTPTQSPNLLTLFHIIAGMYSNSPCARRWLCVFAYDWVGTGGPKLCSRTHNKLDTQKYRDSAILLPESEIWLQSQLVDFCSGLWSRINNVNSGYQMKHVLHHGQGTEHHEKRAARGMTAFRLRHLASFTRKALFNTPLCRPVWHYHDHRHLHPVDPAEEDRAAPPCSGLHQHHTHTHALTHCWSITSAEINESNDNSR